MHRPVLIGTRAIGEGHPPFIVAEVGINHNGDVDRALEMIRVAAAAGADAVKFQTFKADEFVGDASQTFTYRSQGREVTESMLAMFRRHELPADAWRRLADECERQGVMFLSTPQNRGDLAMLLAVGVPAIKVGSDDFTNLPLLRDYARTGLPLILSCGMSDLAEVYRALETTGALEGYPTILLLCTSLYPTPPADVNLRRLRTLQAAFPMIVTGFSDHTEGPLASALAAALGASFFEKHFTLDHDLPGPDHWFSEDPAGLRAWVEAIRTAAAMQGSPVVQPTPAERANKREYQRCIVAAAPIAAGEPLSAENLTMRRVRGGGLPASLYDMLLGSTAHREYSVGEPIQL